MSASLRFRLVEVARSSFRTSGVPSSFHRFALGRELRLQDKFGIARLEVSLGIMIARATLDVYFVVCSIVCNYEKRRLQELMRLVIMRSAW